MTTEYVSMNITERIGQQTKIENILDLRQFEIDDKPFL
jgi:hypothetical protein